MRKVVKEFNMLNILDKLIRSQGGQVRYSYTQDLHNNTMYIIKDKRGNRIVYDPRHNLLEVKQLNGTFNRTNSLRGFQLILESLYK